MSVKSTMNIAVIGAGWAGLAAALRLKDAGANVTVFEAAPIAGGRARGVDDVEAAEIRTQVHGVALFKMCAGAGEMLRNQGQCLAVGGGFFVLLVGHRSGSGQAGGGSDKTLREIDTDDVGTKSGEFEGRSADSAAKIESAGLGGDVG